MQHTLTDEECHSRNLSWLDSWEGLPRCFVQAITQPRLTADCDLCGAHAAEKAARWTSVTRVPGSITCMAVPVPRKATSADKSGGADTAQVSRPQHACALPCLCTARCTDRLQLWRQIVLLVLPSGGRSQAVLIEHVTSRLTSNCNLRRAQMDQSTTSKAMTQDATALLEGVQAYAAWQALTQQPRLIRLAVQAAATLSGSWTPGSCCCSTWYPS